MKLSAEEHIRRKQASALRCLDESGKPISEEAKSVAVHDKGDKCDVNKIVARVLRTGSPLPSLNRPDRFGDFTSAVDYQELSNRVIRMNQEFMKLDPKIRLKFDNDPAKLVDFLSDKKNKKEAVELGILPKPVYKTVKQETPAGDFWVTFEDDIEIRREEIKKVAAAPAA